MTLDEQRARAFYSKTFAGHPSGRFELRFYTSAGTPHDFVQAAELALPVVEAVFGDLFARGDGDQPRVCFNRHGIYLSFLSLRRSTVAALGDEHEKLCAVARQHGFTPGK